MLSMSFHTSLSIVKNLFDLLHVSCAEVISYEVTTYGK